MTVFKRQLYHFCVQSVAIIFCITAICQIIYSQENSKKPTRFDSLQIKQEHPRIWIDAGKMKWLKEKCKGKTPEEVSKMVGPSIAGLSLTYLITGDEKLGQMAIEKALSPHVDSGSIHKDLDTKEGKSKTRSIQEMLADQALCYDWCYPLLSPEQKTEFRNLMVPQMKKSVAFKRVWRSFHNGMYANAWPLTAATIALFGDEPYATETLDFLKPELEDVMRTFDNVFPDGEWAEGMDYNRHSTYHAIRLFLALKTAAGFDVFANSPHLPNTGAYIIYSAKANGLALQCDDNDWPYIGPWERTALLMLNEVYQDAYNQYFINHCPDERFQFEPSEKYIDLLWYNPAIKEKPLSELPLSRIFRGKGLVITRSGWNWDKPGIPADDVWLTFHCGDYMGDHVHADINSFAISHKGELALDAGRYDDDWGAVIGDPNVIGKSQFFNYYKRTIAHNTILVYDPNEKMSEQLLNDGGQMDLLRVDTKDGKLGPRNVPEDYDQGNFPSEEGIATCDWATNPGRWETGDITSYKATNNFMYVRGDGTKAYSAVKMNSYIRQLVYLQPNIVVVMDRVVSTNPDFKKTWLLHSVNEPLIAKNNRSIEITEGEGKLVCIPVLPHQMKVSKIGGPGNECLVDTVHFKYGMNSAFDPTELHYGEIAGAWRIEENPAVPLKEDYFLNVILVSDKNSKEVPEVKIISETNTEITIQLNTKNEKSAVLKFTKGEKPTAHIKLLNGKNVLVDEEMPDSVEPEEGRLN
jgi:hypothetical protein